MKVGLETQIKYLVAIVVNMLQPDVLLVYEISRQVVMLELSVSWEGIEEATDRKNEKYTELVEQYCRQGWRTRCLRIKVGAGGFVGKSLCKTYSLLHITGACKGKSIGRASGTSHGRMFFGHRLGTDHSWLSCLNTKV